MLFCFSLIWWARWRLMNILKFLVGCERPFFITEIIQNLLDMYETDRCTYHTISFPEQVILDQVTLHFLSNSSKEIVPRTFLGEKFKISKSCDYRRNCICIEWNQVNLSCLHCFPSRNEIVFRPLFLWNDWNTSLRTFRYWYCFF